LVSGAGTNQIAEPHVQMEVKVERILNVHQQIVHSIKGCKVAIFCGIAKPHLFKKTVERLGAGVVLEWVLADHEPVSNACLQHFILEAKSRSAQALICTEKDYVKLDLNQEFSLPIYFLEISLVVSGGHSLWENLIAKIIQKIDNYNQYE
jgi:tetraacyldisaccharide 4'-kinase